MNRRGFITALLGLPFMGKAINAIPLSAPPKSIAYRTFSNYETIGFREDLLDVIYDITPTETPFSHNITRGQAKQVVYEWKETNGNKTHMAEAEKEEGADQKRENL